MADDLKQKDAKEKESFLNKVRERMRLSKSPRAFQVASLSSLLVLLTVLPLLVILSHQPQDTRQHATGEVIDTFSYFLTHHPDKVLTGTHQLSQFVSGQNIYNLLWTAQDFQGYRYDATYIYLVEDHYPSPQSPNTLSDGIWMKRSMQVGELLTMPPDNIIQNYDNSCQQIASQTGQPHSGTPFRAITSIEQHLQLDVGGDLGVQDIIVLKYDFTGGNFERYYYSHEWGLVKWEYYTNNVLTQTSIFNKISTQTPIAPPCSTACTPFLQVCPAPTPTTTPVNTVTPTPTGIVTPSQTPQPTQTPLPAATVTLTLYLHGIGKGGDNANPYGVGNNSPQTPTRQFTLSLLKGTTAVATESGTLTYDASAGDYTGSIPISPPSLTGDYTIGVKTAGFLREASTIPYTVTSGQTTNAPVLRLTAGDIIDDNTLDILDYNALLSCVNPPAFVGVCTAKLNRLSDLDDNGTVTLTDMNLFLREIGSQP